MSNELLVIENVELVPFFTKGEAVDETLAKIEAEAMAFVPGDLSVKKNRDAVKAMVTKVTKSKTYLEKHGKELAAEYKLIPKQIDAQRKKVKDNLTLLAESVRRPLTEYEIEDKRIKEEQAEQERLAEIAEKIELLWDDAHSRLNQFNLGILMTEDLLADQQKKRDEEIARVAAGEAKAKAEREAQAEIEAAKAAEAKAKQDAIDAENKRLADIEAARVREEQQRQAAIQAEIELQEAEERRIAQEAELKRQAEIAEQQRVEREKQLAIEAEQRAKQAELDRIENERQAKILAEQAAEQARLDEVARQEAIKKQEADQLSAREANKTHIGQVCKQAKETLMAATGLTEEQARAVITAIAKNQVANCKINY